jgi:hypothetical protein
MSWAELILTQGLPILVKKLIRKVSDHEKKQGVFDTFSLAPRGWGKYMVDIPGLSRHETIIWHKLCQHHQAAHAACI